MPEAPLEDSGAGLAPAGDGWFVVNVRDALWWTSDTRGSMCPFESEQFEFPQLGINLHVLDPGRPIGLADGSAGPHCGTACPGLRTFIVARSPVVTKVPFPRRSSY